MKQKLKNFATLGVSAMDHAIPLLSKRAATRQLRVPEDRGDYPSSRRQRQDLSVLENLRNFEFVSTRLNIET